MKYLIHITLLLISITASAQQLTEREKLQQMAQQKEYEKSRQIRAQMDSGIFYLDQGEYELADVKFRYALANMRSIPSDLTFFFGKNSFHLEKYKQSVDWLNKYIQLKGTSGQYSSEATEILKKAEILLVQEHTVSTQKTTELLAKDYDIDCGPSGMVKCPACNGTTVIIKKEYLGETYKTCPFCNHKGTLNCVDYNKLLRGQLKGTDSK